MRWVASAPSPGWPLITLTENEARTEDSGPEEGIQELERQHHHEVGGEGPQDPHATGHTP